MSLALIGVMTVPGATMMVPSQSPSGMSPAGLFLYSSSSSSCDILISFGTVSCAVVTAMVISFTSALGRLLFVPTGGVAFHGSGLSAFEPNGNFNFTFTSRPVNLERARRADLRGPHRLGHAEEDHDTLAPAARRERLVGAAEAAVDVLPVVHHPDVARRRDSEVCLHL